MSLITKLFNQAPPHPDFTNVEPAGRGWYVYSQKKWRRYEVNGYNPEAKWLSANRLLELELDAQIAARLAAQVKRPKKL